jgi:hypothetical protein
MTTTQQTMATSGILTLADRWDHVLARWGYRRSEHRVAPGLYTLGNPAPASPVFVTANYTLSFDALRSSLRGVDGYILVLDTDGINVWCAAGKGTFGTDELVRRIEASGLAEVVSHRKLILPQLGAPGIAAHEVKQRTGFSVIYGPVRATDLPEFLATGAATPAMRQVRFNLRDRAVLVPVELVHVLLPLVAVSLPLGLLVSPLAGWAVVTCVLAGAALFPLLLPWLPGRAFSAKGFALGGLVALPFALLAVAGLIGSVLWEQLAWAIAFLLAMPAVTAYLALNFTGATTFTSRTGVAREMRAFIPAMAWLFGTGVVLTLGLAIYGRIV